MLLHTETRLFERNNEGICLFTELFYKKRSPHLLHHYYELLQTFLSHRTRILDIRAGSGSLVYYLAQKGYDMVGLEQSPKLLALARAKNISRQAKVDLRLSETLQTELGEHFNAIIARDTVQHILTPEEFAGFFNHVHRHLLDYGVFMFDFPTEYAFPAGKSEMVKERQPRASSITIIRDVRRIQAENIALLDWQINVPSEYSYTARTCAKWYEKNMVKDTLHQAGFHHVRFFDVSGHAKSAPLEEEHSDSELLLCVARKVGFNDSYGEE